MKTTFLLRFSGHLVVAALVCTVLGSIVQTQFNLAALQTLGVPMPLDVRLQATAADLLGFTPSFGPVVLLSFAMAFTVAARLSASRPAWRRICFLLAGSGAIFTAMISMEMLFSVTPIAAARGPAGMAAVCFCGTIGGFVFDRLRSGVPRSR